MGRKKSKYICPKCQNPGYIRWKTTWNAKSRAATVNRYPYVVHYDHKTKNRSECCINGILQEQELVRFKNQPNGQIIYDITQYGRRTIVYLHRFVKMMRTNDREPDLATLWLMKKSTKLLYLHAWLMAKTLKLNEFKQILGENNQEIRKLELELNEYRSKMENDFEMICSLVSKDSLFEMADNLIRNFNENYRRLKGKNRDLLVKRWTNVLISVCDAPAYLVPFVLASENWFITCKIPEMIKSKKKLRRKLSEAAFGSDKNLGLIFE